MHVEKQLRLGLFDPGFSAIDSIDRAPVFDLDFTQGRPYAHRIVNKTAATATRASAANRYWLQPADDVGVNVLRYAQKSAINHLNGLLIEGADQNVILQNTIFAAPNWTVSVNLAVIDVTDVDLYGGHSFEAQAGAAGETYVYQTAALTAVKYIVEALVYTDGSAVTAANCRMAAGASGAIAGLASTYEHVGGGVYLVWAVFTATAANWDVGLNIRPSQLVFFSLLSCYLAAPTQQGGDFSRSPIPNATGAAITRAADVYTHPGTNNFGTSAGMVDLEFTAPCAEAAVSTLLVLFHYHVVGGNQLYIYYRGATNDFSVWHEVGGASQSARAALGMSRNDIVRVRIAFNTGTVDGTNYLKTWRKVNAGAWAQLAVDANALGGNMPTGGTIHIGRHQSGIYHAACFIRRVRVFNYSVNGSPGDWL